MTKPIDRDHAHQVVGDLLGQLEGEADGFLDEVQVRRGVRGSRVVGPLIPSGFSFLRFSLKGEVGNIEPRGQGWFWYVVGSMVPPRLEGTAPTRLAADRALCLALQELGWAPVEVPPEPLEHVVELPPGFEPVDVQVTVEVNAPRQACPDCDGTGIEEDYGGPWDCPRCDGSGEAPVDEPAEYLARRMEDAARRRGGAGATVPARTMEDIVPGINAQLRADRAEIRRRGQGVDYGLVLDTTAGPMARVTDDGRALEFSNLTPAQVEVVQRQMEPISTRTRDPALYALLQVVRLPDGASLWSYLDAADRRLLVMEPIVVDPIP